MNGKIYIDLCDDDYKAVEVDAEGWSVIENPPVWFMRSPSMLPLPEPKDGASLIELREFIHLPDEDFVLLAGWLVAACNPEGPFPLLAISSEQGSGKSTATTLLKMLIDPDINPRLAQFKDADAIFSTAASRWLMAYDNLSKISEDDSNHLCRLATGGGFSKRKLFSDNDSFSCQAKRPLILNGIALTLGKLDLLDRAYLIRMSSIPAGARKTERELYASFREKHPFLLGALLRALSCALSEPSYVPENLPRMADGAEFIMRAERGGGFPWPEGTFYSVHSFRESEKRDDAILDDPVASRIVELASEGGWSGSMKALLVDVSTGCGEGEKRYLPATPRGLGKKLEELKPLLRSSGTVWEKRRTKTGWHIDLKQLPETEGTGSTDEKVNVVEYVHPTFTLANTDGDWSGEHGERGERRKPFLYAHGVKKFGYPGYPGLKSVVSEENGDNAIKMENNVHHVHNVHLYCDSKASEGERTGEHCGERSPSPVDTASDTPHMGWLEAQSAEVRNEYEKLVEDLSDPMMSKDFHDAEQRALKAIWKERRNPPPGPEKFEDGPGDSSSRGGDPGPVEEDPFTFMDA